MRVHAVVAIMLLLLPAESSAQRLRLPGAGRRPSPPELPPQAPTIARELSYRRLPMSVESYPMYSRVEASGFIGEGVNSSWTSFGAGTRADYRVTRHLSATMDLTSSFLGGPMVMETVEIGTRLRPERNDRRLYPFVDVRYGYAYAYHSYFQRLGDPLGASMPRPAGYSSQYSYGFGGVGGAGVEYALTPTLSLTTAASVMRSRMTAHGFEGVRPTSDRYRMTGYRYMLGIRYNPVRFLQPPAH